MSQLIKTIVFLTTMVLIGCSDKKPHDFFAKGGITIGTPTASGAGSYKIPLECKTAIVHSGQWMDAVDAVVAGSDILITASFSSSQGKSAYPGYINVSDVTPGTYTLKYRDPDGTLHAIGSVVLP